MSASLKIIFADFPPSSNETFLRFVSDESLRIKRPTGVEPVKAIF
jgi:hypothetical protein